MPILITDCNVSRMLKDVDLSIVIAHRDPSIVCLAFTSIPTKDFTLCRNLHSLYTSNCDDAGAYTKDALYVRLEGFQRTRNSRPAKKTTLKATNGSVDTELCLKVQSPAFQWQLLLPAYSPVSLGSILVPTHRRGLNNLTCFQMLCIYDC